ncbi:MAG: hypothetical protein FWG19_03750, partial [Methanomassiliicoccaceae archaeon]|nr:hypothetical protein [Methanomassiliicoccaceae archaeon]
HIMSMQTKQNKTVLKAVEAMIKFASKKMSDCLITDGGRILIPRDSMVLFKEYVRKIHARANEQQMTGLPCKPRRKCGDCGFFHMCTGGETDDGIE